MEIIATTLSKFFLTPLGRKAGIAARAGLLLMLVAVLSWPATAASPDGDDPRLFVKASATKAPLVLSRTAFAATTADSESATCQECGFGADNADKVSELTLQYNGISSVNVKVYDNNDDSPSKLLFDGTVGSGDTFTFFASTIGKDNFSSKIGIYINDVEHFELHTSCSKPLGPGTPAGNFTVTAGKDKNGDDLCAVPPPPSCLECGFGDDDANRVRTLTFEYTGPTTFVRIRNGGGASEDILFEGNVTSGQILTIDSMNPVSGNAEDKLASDIRFRDASNDSISSLHASCSQPLGPGTTVSYQGGTFTVTAGTDEDGVPLCPTSTPPPSFNGTCFVVADSQNDLLRLDITNGQELLIGDTGVGDVEAIALSPSGGTLYAANAGTFGTLSTSSGSFNSIGSFGTAGGSAGNISLSDVDGLAFDPTTGILYGTHRRSGPDVLFQINIATGAHVPNAFGSGVDYVVVPAIGSRDNVDDLAIHPGNGTMYATLNNGGQDDRLITINKTTGASSSQGSLGVDDMEGLTFLSNGSLYGTTGSENNSSDDNKLWSISLGGSASLISVLDDDDYEALACPTGGGATNTTDPELKIQITGTPPGGQWDPGETVPLGVNVCNNAFSDGSSDGECSGGTNWPSPVENENIEAKLLLPSRLTFANNVTCNLDTDGDGQFDDGACPGGSFGIQDNGGGNLVLTYPDLPVGQGAQIGFDTVVGDGATEVIEVPSEISQGTPNDADATPDNCNLPGGAPGIGEDDCDKLSLTVEASPFAGTCFVVADSQNDLLRVDIVTGVEQLIGDTGVGNVEAIALSPSGGTLYAANAGTFGTLSTSSGSFNSIGSFGTAGGSAGNISLSDVDGLAFDPTTGVLYGAHRRSGDDVLFQINVSTGAHVPNAFGAGIDYVVVPGISNRHNVDDLAIHPSNGTMYAILNDSGQDDLLITINKTTGASSSQGSLGVNDMEGLTFLSNGSLYGTTGNENGSSDDNKLWSISLGGSASLISALDNDDYEALACPTGGGVTNTTDPELRLGITNLLQEPPGGWCPPGPPECVPLNFSVNICNNDLDGASSPGGQCNSGGSPWPNPVTYEDVRAKLQLSPRLVYANTIVCNLDTDGDGQFDDGACPGGTFSVIDNGGGNLTLNYPDLPAGQGAQITFDATVTGVGTEGIKVLSEVSKAGLPTGVPDADATPDNCDLVNGPPSQDDCDEVNLQVTPVEMTRFESELDGTTALLLWETASETGNAGFEVQHRAADSEAFEALGFVEGVGTTLETQTYSFSVRDLTPGRHVFRLKQIDFDGTFAYSSQIEVSVGIPEAFLVSKVYPNPFNPEASLSFGVKQEQEVRIELFNMLGQRVKVLYAGRPAAGTTKTLQIDGSDLRSGVYILRVQGERFIDTQTITLIK